MSESPPHKATYHYGAGRVVRYRATADGAMCPLWKRKPEWPGWWWVIGPDGTRTVAYIHDPASTDSWELHGKEMVKGRYFTACLWLPIEEPATPPDGQVLREDF